MERDETESGERKLLNFGHTLGHAYEKYYGYTGLSHGRAVAVGMAARYRGGRAAGSDRPGTLAACSLCSPAYGLPRGTRLHCRRYSPPPPSTKSGRAGTSISSFCGKSATAFSTACRSNASARSSAGRFKREGGFLMATAVITPSPIAGALAPPPSKSAAHRFLLAAALGARQGQRADVRGVQLSADMEATLRAAAGLGVDARIEGGAVRFVPSPRREAPVTVDCGESGSTLRFLIPVYAALGIPATFTGGGRLPERPLGVYADLLPAHGVRWKSAGGLPLAISGRLSGGEFALRGTFPAQFITGLLFALPLCREDSRIRLTPRSSRRAMWT